MKFGMQADRLGNDVLIGESRNRVLLHWDTHLVSDDPSSRGTYGYYQVRSNGVRPEAGVHHRRQRLNARTSACSSRTHGRSTTA